MHLDDIRRRQRLECRNLALNLFLDVISQLVDVNALDRHLLSVFALPVEDLPAGTFPQRMRLENTVIRNLLNHSLTHFILLTIDNISLLVTTTPLNQIPQS